MALPEADVSKELTVTFHPPLYLERRGWVFEILRREGVRTVLDVGCGQGELISCLCNPAPWLPPPPASVLESLSALDSSTDWEDDLSSLAQSEPLVESYLHPTKVIGLDVSAADLQYAIQDTAPRTTTTGRAWTRWEPLEVKIWHGGLESVNPEFVDVECIVSTEVIEHLPEEILHDFAPIMLGVYHPRLLLITTPSYTFNARFTAPDAPASARSGYADPTGRTSRIFRHHDHKFEWTVEEFTEWCERIAADWEYDVEIGGVGKPIEKDEWEREEELGFASQVAAFRRRDGQQYAEKRKEKIENIPHLADVDKRQKHELLATHYDVGHEKARQPKPLQEIGEHLQSTMIRCQERTMRVADLWFEEQVSEMCGGWIEVLMKAIEEDQDLQLHKPSSKMMSDWEVELMGESSQKVLWQEQLQYQTAVNDSLSPGWLQEPESPQVEHTVVVDLENIDSHWDNGTGETDTPDEDKFSSHRSSSAVLSEGWGPVEVENNWGVEGWAEPSEIPAVETEAVW